MLDNLLKLNIRILLSYLSAALWTYYIGFGLSKFFGPDLLKLIFIVGIFVISFVLSFWIIHRILPMKQKSLIKNKFLRFLCTVSLSLFVVVSLAHMTIWAIGADIISLQVKSQDDFLAIPGISSVQSYVYGDFMLDSAWMFKFRAEPDTVKEIVSYFNLAYRYDLNNSDKKNVVKVLSKGSGYLLQTPYWWDPKFNDRLEFYESKGTTDRIDYDVMYDPKTKKVYMK